MIAVAQDPHGREAGEGQRPAQQVRAVEGRRIGDDLDLTRKAARRESCWFVGIAQDVHEIEGAVA